MLVHKHFDMAVLTVKLDHAKQRLSDKESVSNVSVYFLETRSTYQLVDVRTVHKRRFLVMGGTIRVSFLSYHDLCTFKTDPASQKLP